MHVAHTALLGLLDEMQQCADTAWRLACTLEYDERGKLFEIARQTQQAATLLRCRMDGEPLARPTALPCGELDGDD